MYDVDLVYSFVFVSAFCLEIYFIFKDIKNIREFHAQNPSKKEILKYFGFGFLRFILFLVVTLLISVLLNFIPYLYYWSGRNKALIEALRPGLNSDFGLFRFVYWFLFPVSLVYVAIIKIAKKRIALSIVFPIIIICGVISLITLAFDYDYKYYRNPLADTKVSSSFKPLNVPLLKEGMRMEDVRELLGEPISEDENLFVYAKPNGWGWYDYFCLDVYFENDVVVKIDKRWEYED